MESPNSPDLVLLRNGNNQAWADFYDSVAADLRAFVLRLGARDPDDVVGETMMQLVRDIAKYPGEPSGLRPWTYQIARHRVIDASRKRSRRPTETPLDDDQLDVPSSAASDFTDLAHLAEGFSHLSTEQREILWLRYVADFSVADTALITAKTPDAVTAMSHRALARLRTLLSGL